MIAYRKEKEGNIITKKGEAMHNIGYKRLLVQYIGRQEPEQPIFTTQLTRHVARMTGRDEEDVKKAVNVNMARMEKDGQVVRIEKGVYCKKIRTAFGYYIPDKEAIFCKRLLYDEGEVIGYETGLSMLNRMGLVSQMPKKCIVTNLYAKRVPAGMQVEIRKPAININRTNYRYFQILDVIGELEKASVDAARPEEYLSLPRTFRKELEDDRKGSITAVYDYTPAVTVDADDSHQRFGYVKVEGTSFIVSEPFSELEIEPIIYTCATGGQREILRKQFEVMPFLIKTIRLERIFADKIFAAEFYYERAMYFDVAKHVYDVGIMLGLQSVRDMMEDKRMFLEMLGYKRLEETRRTGSDLAEKEFSDFQIFHGFCHNSNLKDAYQNMQRNYVFSEKDMLPFEFITSQWGDLGKILINL